MDPNNPPNDGSQGSFPGTPFSAYQPIWNPYLYGFQAPPPWFQQGMSQLPPNVSMMHPSQQASQVFQPGENAIASSQNCEEDVDDVENEEEVSVPSGPIGKGKKTKGVGRSKLSNFSTQEDVYLIKSWLEISLDPINGCNQKKDGMWLKILSRYNYRRGSYPERSLRSIQSRIDVIKAETGKFASTYADVIRENPSGMSDADKTTRVASNFADIYKHAFAYLHCWEVVKDDPKWQDLLCSRKEATGQGFGEDPINLGDDVSTSHADNRPMGRDRAKAAKKKANSDAGSASSAEHASRMQELSLQRMSIMEEENARKDQRFQQLQSHNAALLLLEQEKVRMQREKHDKEIEEKEKLDDERILKIDLNSCTPALRLYYEALQEEIMEKIEARRRNRHGPLT